MHDDVGAPLERILDRRRAEGRIDTELPANLMRSPGVVLDRATLSSRVKRSLQPHQRIAAGVFVVQAD